MTQPLLNMMAAQPGHFGPVSAVNYRQNNYVRATVHHSANPHAHVLYGYGSQGQALPNQAPVASPVLDVPYGTVLGDYTAQELAVAELALFPFVGFNPHDTIAAIAGLAQLKYKTFVFGSHQGLFTWTNGTTGDIRPEKLFLTFLEVGGVYDDGDADWLNWDGPYVPLPRDANAPPGPTLHQIDWPDQVQTVTDSIGSDGQPQAWTLSQRRVIIANWVKGYNAVATQTEIATDDLTSDLTLICTTPPTGGQPPPPAQSEEFQLLQNLVSDNSARLRRFGSGYHTSVVYTGSSVVDRFIVYTHVSRGEPHTDLTIPQLPIDGFNQFPPNAGCAFQIPQ